ncbi:MAG: pseudouridine synthase [Chloroflexota bacterium]
MAPERLQKVLASAGIASRRDCEVLIAEGRVVVNGEVVQIAGTRVDPDVDEIMVDGKPLGARQPRTYIMFHKPVGVVSTTEDPQGRPTVIEMVEVPQRLHLVGRLDFASEGLILLTDDGNITQSLTHPSNQVEKEYRVLLDATPNADDLREWRNGVQLAAVDDEAGDNDNYDIDEAAAIDEPTITTAPAWVEILEQTDAGTWVKVVLHEGRKRQIRRVAQALGYNVLRLIRMREGPIQLGDLPAGAWRALSDEEVTKLQQHADRAESMARLIAQQQAKAAAKAAKQAAPAASASDDSDEVAPRGNRLDEPEQPRGDRPRGRYGERSFGDRPQGGGFRRDGDAPRGERSFGDRPPRSFGDRPQGGGFRRDGDRPQGGGFRRDGDAPRGDRPQGDRPFSDRPRGGFGDRPQGGGFRRDGDAPRGERSFGDRPPRSFGDRPQGGGFRRDGDAPRGDRPQGDRPRGGFGDRPQGGGFRRDGDAPRGDRPQGDRPFSDRPRGGFGDRPQGGGFRRDGDAPRGERSVGDRPPRSFGDRPQGGGFRRDGDRPQGGGFRRDGDRPQGGGFRRDGDRPQGGGFRRDGDRPQGGGFRRDGDRPQGGGFRRDGEAPRRDGDDSSSFGGDRSRPRRRF